MCPLCRCSSLRYGREQLWPLSGMLCHFSWASSPRIGISTMTLIELTHVTVWGWIFAQSLTNSLFPKNIYHLGCNLCDENTTFLKVACQPKVDTQCEICSNVFRENQSGNKCGSCLPGYYHGTEDFPSYISMCQCLLNSLYNCLDCQLCAEFSNYLHTPCSNVNTVCHLKIDN